MEKKLFDYIEVNSIGLQQKVQLRNSNFEILSGHCPFGQEALQICRFHFFYVRSCPLSENRSAYVHIYKIFKSIYLFNLYKILKTRHNGICLIRFFKCSSRHWCASQITRNQCEVKFTTYNFSSNKVVSRSAFFDSISLFCVNSRFCLLFAQDLQLVRDFVYNPS